MRPHHWNRSLAVTGLVLLSFFLLVSCGKNEEEEVLATDNTIGAPPSPPPVVDYPTPPPQVADYDTDFQSFNQTMGRCRDHVANKGKLLNFLLMLLAGREVATSSAESRGFKPGGRAGGCMGKLGDQMGNLRHWKDKFRPGALRNWVGHSAQWAVEGTQYPSYWSNGSMPDYVGGSGY